MPMQRRNDCAVRKWKLPFAIGFDRYIVAQLGAQIVEVALLVRHGDQSPVAISGGEFDSVDWGGLSSRLSRYGGRVGDHAGQSYN
jgi:hypothetical protein